MMKQQMLLAIFMTAFVYPAAISAQVAQGASYTLDQSVIASGGGTSSESGGVYSITGTAGQNIAGTTSQTAPYAWSSGFWTAPLIAPTAANVSISGQIRTANGSGIRNVIISLTESNGTMRTTVSATFGYYQFTGVASGQIVILSVTAKKFSFDQSIRLLHLTKDLTAIDFIAN